MPTAAEIEEFLEQAAPLELAESYDNPGFLAGDAGKEVRKALVALDITLPVCREAHMKGAQLIISHHPVIFKPVRAVLRQGSTAVLWELMNLGLSAICMHTNLDIADGGVNDTFAECLNLEKKGVLQIKGCSSFVKLVVFVPESHAEAVRTAMAQAGAGKLGDYDSCSFESRGNGFFRPLEGAKPFIGKAGETARVDEVRIEAILRRRELPKVIAAMKAAHPYEEPAYDVFPDEGIEEPFGVGMIAEAPEPLPPEEFARFVAGRLSAQGVKIADAGKTVRRIAVCSGAWDDELTLLAVGKGADTVLTGEIKHSGVLLALSCGLNVVAAGHFATENVICAPLAARLAERFPDVRFETAESGTDPFRFILP